MIFKRKTRCKKLLNDIKSFGNRMIFFSDEKSFTVDPMINKQNDRVVSFGQDISSHLHSSTTKHPASLMMLGVIASTGDKMPPVWFKTGYRLKGEDYKEILKTKVLFWIKKITKKRNYRYVFQQDGALAHTSKIVQSWMSSNMNF